MPPVVGTTIAIALMMTIVIIITAVARTRDAAIAMQAVLTLVEPQSSGIGGGALIVLWDGKAVRTYDGRETAPAGATAEPAMTLRVATFNTSLYDEAHGGLIERLDIDGEQLAGRRLGPATGRPLVLQCQGGGRSHIAASLLRAWQGWLDLKRQELDRTTARPAAEEGSGIGTARIEMADLKERIRKLEAIASGVEL